MNISYGQTNAVACFSHRSRLEALALPSDPNVAEHKKFFCASSLRAFFTPQVVEDILNCACQRCSRLRQQLGLSQSQYRHAKQRIANTFSTVDGRNTGSKLKDGRIDGTNAYCLTLGLVLYIDYPALVLALAHQQFTDASISRVLDELSLEGIRERFWSRLQWRDESEVLSVTKKLRWQRYQFFLPVLKAGLFSDYNENVILPFLDEQKIGVANADGEIESEGAYGQIYSFQIPDEYHTFTTETQVYDSIAGLAPPRSINESRPVRFVRKELRDNSNSCIFQTESKNLDYIQLIKDPHIVKVLKAYKHGGTGNIIFPEARTNLYHYLHDARHGASDVPCSSVEDHPFWIQINGLARGVHKILNYEAEDVGNSDVLYGYHFDLKPANILIEHSGRFIISDFGQAHFKKIGASSSRVVGFGGTESYAPPEFDDPDMRQNRKYDIWSLGCIFLEITTFIVLGQQGVDQLDQLRISRSADGSVTDDRFVARQNGTWQLKPAIVAWMDHLVMQVPFGSPRIFLGDMIEIIGQMLTVDIEARCNSRDLCCMLSATLDHRRPSTTTNIPGVLTSQPVIPTAPNTGAEIGAEAMSRITTLKFHYQHCWSNGRFKLVRTSNQLDLLVVQGKHEQKVPIGDIRYLRLIPLYALKDKSQHRFKDSSLYLHGKGDVDDVRLGCDQFYSDNRMEILYLQEALLGQRIMLHLEAAGAVLRPSYADGGIFAGRIFGERPHNRRISTDTREDSPSIQFWRDGFRVRRASEGQINAAEAYERRFRPSLCRIVLFTPGRIHVIQISDLINLAASEAADLKLHIKPSAKATDSSFDCLTITTEPGMQHPGLSMNSQLLQFEEDTKATKLSAIEIKFCTLEDVEAFRKKYRSLKYTWDEDRKACMRLQNEMGPRLGYAPNTL